MQGGDNRQLDIDAPRDRNARKAVVRAAAVAHEPLVANAIAPAHAGALVEAIVAIAGCWLSGR